MYSSRNVGWIVLAGLMLLLAACNGTRVADVRRLGRTDQDDIRGLP